MSAADHMALLIREAMTGDVIIDGVQHKPNMARCNRAADALAAAGYGDVRKAEAERDRLTVDLSLLSKSCGHWKRSAEKAEAKTAEVLADLKALADRLAKFNGSVLANERYGEGYYDGLRYAADAMSALITQHETGEL